MLTGLRSKILFFISNFLWITVVLAMFIYYNLDGQLNDKISILIALFAMSFSFFSSLSILATIYVYLKQNENKRIEKDEAISFNFLALNREINRLNKKISNLENIKKEIENKKNEWIKIRNRGNFYTFFIKRDGLEKTYSISIDNNIEHILRELCLKFIQLDKDKYTLARNSLNKYHKFYSRLGTFFFTFNENAPSRSKPLSSEKILTYNLFKKIDELKE